MTATPPSRFARFAAKFGAAAFLFFLIKGLLWLIVPAAIGAVAWLGLDG